MDKKAAFLHELRVLLTIFIGYYWLLLGFEDRHVFEPPFGDYDRDYPGFTIDAKFPA